MWQPTDGRAILRDAHRLLGSVRAAPFLSLALVAATAVGTGISGVVSVRDGDTLRIGSGRIRLHGIDISGVGAVLPRRRRDLGLCRCGHPGASRVDRRPVGRLGRA